MEGGLALNKSVVEIGTAGLRLLAVLRGKKKTHNTQLFVSLAR